MSRRGSCRWTCWRDPHVPVRLARSDDSDQPWPSLPLIRGHSAWALGRIPLPRSTAALLGRLQLEAAGGVRGEIGLVLQEVADWSSASSAIRCGRGVRAR
jgi:hypothetical protein